MKFNRILTVTGFIIALHFLTACGVRSIPMSKNEVEAKLAEVTNQYKRRADLIPNLVSTVKGYAGHEKETLEAVVNARAKATSMNIDPSKVSADQLMQFQKAQGSLSQALGRLMVVVEKYPNLKADQNFRDLQAQLEGTENRITIARQRHIESIKNYNNLVTVFPTNITNSIFFHYEKMPQWDVENTAEVKQPPKVEFKCDL